MRIFIRAETLNGEPLSKALVQLHSPLLNMDLEGECCNNGRIDFEVDVGFLEKIRWLVYCNGVRQGNFEIEDGDEINIG